MLFKKNAYPFCANCANAIVFNEDTMLCRKKGMVRPDGKCHAFRYDPLKRIPPRTNAVCLKKYDDADFSIDAEPASEA